MLHLEVNCAVRRLFKSLGFKGLRRFCHKQFPRPCDNKFFPGVSNYRYSARHFTSSNENIVVQDKKTNNET